MTKCTSRKNSCKKEDDATERPLGLPLRQPLSRTDGRVLFPASWRRSRGILAALHENLSQVRFPNSDALAICSYISWTGSDQTASRKVRTRTMEEKMGMVVRISKEKRKGIGRAEENKAHFTSSWVPRQRAISRGREFDGTTGKEQCAGLFFSKGTRDSLKRM